MGRLTPGLVWETQKRMTTPFLCKKEAPNKIPGPCWGHQWRSHETSILSASGTKQV